MGDTDPKSRRCPYCGCGFEPQHPEQRYCSALCERQHRLDQSGESARESGESARE
jgi:hypothetical protein